MLMKNAYRIQLDGTGITDALLNYGRDIYRVFQELLETGIQKVSFAPILLSIKLHFSL